MIDTWDEGGAYERFMGRWSIPVADVFLAWLKPEPARNWLDVGCGTGALSGRCGSIGKAQKVLGLDFSSDFIAQARTNYPDPIFDFQIGSAHDLPVESNSFDYVVSGLALNFFPDHPQAVREMVRALRPGGTAAVYVWDYAGRMEMLRHFWDAAVALDPHAAALDEGKRFPICRPEPLRNLFIAANLEEVGVAPIAILARFENFDDFWQPFLRKIGPAPGYVAGLSAAEQNNLAARLRAALPEKSDGTISMTLGAWGVKGKRAG